MTFTLLFLSLVCSAIAAPQFQQQQQQQQFQAQQQQFQAPQQQFQQQQQFQEPVVQVLRDERQNDGYGTFNYAVEADNGIYLENSGFQGTQGQVNMQGGYRLPQADGTFVEVRFISDEFGTRVESPLLPTPPPPPPHVLEQLRIAEEQRAAGITFE